MSAQSAGPVKYVPHLFLLAVLVVEFLLGHATRMDDDELRRTSEEGTTQERLWAWHVLANRDPDGFAFKDHHLKDLLRLGLITRQVLIATRDEHQAQEGQSKRHRSPS